LIWEMKLNGPVMVEAQNTLMKTPQGSKWHLMDQETSKAFCNPRLEIANTKAKAKMPYLVMCKNCISIATRRGRL